MIRGDKQFAESIKKLRANLEISQEEFGKIIGVGKTTVSNYESGYATPPISTLKKIMASFKLPATYFIKQNELTKKDLQTLYGVSIPFFKCTNIDGILRRGNAVLDSTITLPPEAEYIKGKCVATAAPDNMMNGCGIRRGTCVIIDLDTEPTDGSIFAAIRNDELILRRMHRDLEGNRYMAVESTKVRSCFSNEKIPQQNFTVLGTVTKIIMDAKNLKNM